jgi:hypothetical protein
MLEDDGGSFAAGCALSFSRQPSDQPGPEPVMVRIVVDLTKQDDFIGLQLLDELIPRELAPLSYRPDGAGQRMVAMDC